MSSDSAEVVYHQHLIIGVSASLLILCFLTTAMRLWSRKITRADFWYDDYAIVFVLVISVWLSTSQFLGVAYGSGKHADQVQPADFRKFLINLYLFMVAWVLAIAGVKISLLCFYWRIFIMSTFRKCVLVVLAFITTSSLAILLTFIFQCTPITDFWDPEPRGKCVNQTLFYLITGILNVFTDVAVLALPLKNIWGLKTSVASRLAVTFLFLVGGFVCITSVFRIISLSSVNPKDFTWTNVAAGIWTVVEVEVGLICANLPQCRPLYIRLFRPAQMRYMDSNAGTRPRASRHIISKPLNVRRVGTFDKYGSLNDNVGLTEMKSTVTTKAGSSEGAHLRSSSDSNPPAMPQSLGVPDGFGTTVTIAVELDPEARAARASVPQNVIQVKTVFETVSEEMPLPLVKE